MEDLKSCDFKPLAELHGVVRLLAKFDRREFVQYSDFPDIEVEGSFMNQFLKAAHGHNGEFLLDKAKVKDAFPSLDREIDE